MSHDPGNAFIKEFKLSSIEFAVDPDLSLMACPGCKRIGEIVMMTANGRGVAYCSTCDWSMKVEAPNG
jgi:hypothetical protein